MDWSKITQYGLLGGLMPDSGSPYDKAMEQYSKWGEKGEQAQNPFYTAGTGAIGDYQSWLKNMKDPTAFLNNLTSQYHESPYAKYQQNQAMRAAQNVGSASGLTGSTPLQLQAQQNAADISSQDQQNWLRNVLGVNTQYGTGQQNLITTGQNAANSLTNLYGDLGRQFGTAAYGKENEQNYDMMNYLKLAFQLAQL